MPRARAPRTVADIVAVRPLWTNFRRFGLPSLSQAPCRLFLVIFFFAVRAPMSLLSDSPPDSSQHWLLRRPFPVAADARAPTCCLEPASQTPAGSPFFSIRPFLVTADAPDPTPVLEPASPANPSWIAALPRRPVLVTVDVNAHALTCFGACQPREPLLDFLPSFPFFGQLARHPAPVDKSSPGWP